MKKENNIYYFIGNITSHALHALPLYSRIGGTFIVTSNRAAHELEKYKVPVICIDDVPYIWKRGRVKFYRQRDYIIINHRHKATINYLNSSASVVIFYELFEFTEGQMLSDPKTIFLTHGNMLKNYFGMYPKRLRIIKEQYDYMAAIGPYMKHIFLESGIPRTKLVDIGIARTDEVVKLKHDNHLSDKLKSLGITKNKPIVSYLPTFWGDSSVGSLGIKIIENISSDLQLLVRLHPQTPRKIIDKYKNNHLPNVRLLLEGDKNSVSLLEILEASDIIIGDLSSVMLESLLLDKPLIFAKTDTTGGSMINNQLDDIYNYSSKINSQNVGELNTIIKDSIARGVDVKLWSNLKKKCFYNPNGDSVKSIAKFITTLT